MREQLLGLKEKNEKLEALVSSLEEEKDRLQEKLNKVMAAGEHLLGEGSLSAPLVGSRGSSLFLRERAGAGAGVHEDQVRRLWKGTLAVSAGCLC